MLKKSISFMSENLNSNNFDNDKFHVNYNERDYQDLIIRLKEIQSTIALLEQEIFK